MVLSCKACGTTVQDWKKFKSHHFLYHKNEDIRCPSFGCTAQYDMTSSFRRHYKKEHENISTSSLCNLFSSRSLPNDLDDMGLVGPPPLV